MSKSYTLYDAKAHFSQVIREVRAGEIVTVSYRGEPVAEIRAVQKSKTALLEQRIEALRRSGEIIPPETSNFEFKAVAHRPGALARFLAERDD